MDTNERMLILSKRTTIPGVILPRTPLAPRVPTRPEIAIAELERDLAEEEFERNETKEIPVPRLGRG